MNTQKKGRAYTIHAGVRIAARIPEATYVQLIALGGGSVSAGIREATRLACMDRVAIPAVEPVEQHELIVRLIGG